jgi:spore germination cell wall hydrolase CwlJ-like protein
MYIKWKLLPILFLGMLGFSNPVNANDNEIICLAENIYFEARGESTAGRMAVALVVLNRVKDRRFPNSVCGVVKQTKYYPSGRIDLHSCQFSWYCDGKSDAPADRSCWEDALLIAEVMYTYDSIDVTNGSLWYHSKRVNPNWATHYQQTVSIDNHIFYKPLD